MLVRPKVESLECHRPIGSSDEEKVPGSQEFPRVYLKLSAAHGVGRLMEAASNSNCGPAACAMTAFDNKRASLPMPQLGVMILPFRDAVDRFAVGPGFPHREPSYACWEPIPKSIAVPCTRVAISTRLTIRGNELAAVLLWHYGVRWRTPTGGFAWARIWRTCPYLARR
jgi:hypothetical protein